MKFLLTQRYNMLEMIVCMIALGLLITTKINVWIMFIMLVLLFIVSSLLEIHMDYKEEQYNNLHYKNELGHIISVSIVDAVCRELGVTRIPYNRCEEDIKPDRKFYREYEKFLVQSKCGTPTLTCYAELKVATLPDDYS